MGSNSFGQSGLILEHAGDLIVERAGLWTGSCRYSLPRGRFDLLPKRNSEHPYANFLGMEKMRVVFSAGLWQAHVEYAGIDGEVKDEDKDYELSPGTGNEPIESHPDFADFAGTASAPLNGAVFRDPVTGEVSTDDETAEFDRFKLTSVLAGAEEWITQNNTVYTVSWAQKDKPVDEAIAVVTELPGSAPIYGGAYNWLRMPIAYSKRGFAFTCSQRYICSGKKGWSELVYANE